MSLEVSKWVVWLVMLAVLLPVVQGGTLAFVESKSLTNVEYAVGGQKWEYTDNRLTFIKDGRSLGTSRWNVYDSRGQVLTNFEVEPVEYGTHTQTELQCTGYTTTYYGDVDEYECDGWKTLTYAGNGSSYKSCASQRVVRTWRNESRVCSLWSEVPVQRVLLTNQSWNYHWDSSREEPAGRLRVEARTDSSKTKLLSAFTPPDDEEYTLSWVVSNAPRRNIDFSKYSSVTYGTHTIDWSDLREYVQKVEWRPNNELEVYLKPARGYQEYDPQMGGSGYENALLRYYNLSEGSATKFDETRNEDASSTAIVHNGTCKRGNCINITSATTQNEALFITPAVNNFDWGAKANFTFNVWYLNRVGATIAVDPLLFGGTVDGDHFVGITTSTTAQIQIWAAGTCGGGINNRTSFTPQIDTGQWVMVTGVFDEVSGNISVYIDGSLAGHVLGYSPTSCVTQKNYFGALAGFNTLIGGYDEAMVWNRSLSASEINGLYNGGAGLFWVNGFNTSSPAPGASNFSVNSAGGNVSVIETELINFSINLSYNNTQYPNVSCFLDYAGLNVTACTIQHSAFNSTGANVTTYNVSMRAPIVQNPSSFLVRFNITLNATDQVRQNLTALNLTQSVNPSFVVNNFSFNSLQLETNTDNLRLNITRKFQLLQTNLVLFYNRTRVYNTSDLELQNATLTSGDNITVANKTVSVPIVAANLSLVAIQWQINRVYANGTTLYTNSTQFNQTPRLAYFPQQVRAPNAVESETISINTTLTRNLNIAITNAIIDYNGTNQTATLFINETNYEQRDNNHSIPLINSAGENRSIIAYWTISHDGNTRNVVLQSSHIVSQIRILPCMQDATNKTLNISFRHETTSALLTMDTIQTFFRIRAATAPLSMNRSFGYNFTNLANVTFCKSSAGTPFAIDQFDVYYNKAGYVSREFHDVTDPRTNFTEVQRNLTLYTVETGNVTTITITVIDGNDDPVRLYAVDAFVKDVTTGNLTLVSSELTNFDGQVQMGLDTSRIYRFQVRNPNGNVVEFTDETTIISTSFTIRVFLGQLRVLTNLYAVSHLNASINWTSNNNRFNFTWYDTTGIASRFCMRVSFWNQTNSSTLSDQCTTGSLGSLIYVTNNATGNYRAVGYATLINDGLDYIIDSLDVDRTGRTPIFGQMGLFVALLLFGIMSFIGIATQSIPLTLVFGLIGFSAAWILNFQMISFVGALVWVALFMIYIVRSKS